MNTINNTPTIRGNLVRRAASSHLIWFYKVLALLKGRIQPFFKALRIPIDKSFPSV